MGSLKEYNQMPSVKLDLKFIAQSHSSNGKWKQLFTMYFGETPQISSNSFANVSVVVPTEYSKQMMHLCAVLNIACKAVVLNYFKDERIRKKYQLEKDLELLLSKAKSEDYNLGFYRPDFLYDLNNQAKICEIGARYPLNGWMISYYLRLIDLELGYLRTDLNAENAHLENLIDDLFGKLIFHKKIALVHEDEKGTEIFYLQNEFDKRGLKLISVKPGDLKIKHNTIHAHEHEFSHCILEMDREELKKIRPEVMKVLIAQKSYFNDIRTLILIHDKRILAVLYDAEIMRDYMSEADYNFLKDYLIPSFVITNPNECEDFIDTDQNLILKLNSGGRGIGACVKSDYTIEEWGKIIRENWDRYLIQHFVDQKQFKEVNDNRQIHLVGMLLCKDGETYGSGIFRGSDESVINVHQGRALIYPALMQ